MTLVVFVESNGKGIAVMLFRKLRHSIFNTMVEQNPELLTNLIIRYAPAGEVIVIHMIAFGIMPFPDIIMTAGVNQKITVLFGVIQIAAVNQKLTVHIEKQADLILRHNAPPIVF